MTNWVLLKDYARGVLTLEINRKDQIFKTLAEFDKEKRDLTSTLYREK